MHLYCATVSGALALLQMPEHAVSLRHILSCSCQPVANVATRTITTGSLLGLYALRSLL